MNTDTLDVAHSLRDPAPPVPGDDARAAVHTRATQIRRRRRATGALAAVSCAALIALGTLAVVDTDPSTRHRVETAAATDSLQADTTPVPATAHIAVQVREGTIPADVELDATLTGGAGTYHAHVRTPGTLTFADVPPGDYELRWDWSSDDGSAASAGRHTVHVEAGDVTFAL